MEYASDILSALADPLRLRALALMAAEGDLCVCELTFALDVKQPKMSKHLATLRDCGLVCDRRDAQWVFYGLAPDRPAWVQDMLAALFRGVGEEPVHAEDRRRLHSMTGRPRCERAA